MARQQDKRPEYAVTLYPDELEAAGHDRRTAEEAHSYMMDRGAKCLRCPLFGLRHGPVRSELRPGAPLLVCGDVPEQDDVDAKQPFVGRAGLMLGEAVWEGGIAREGASFVNAISCRPPEEYNAYTARVRIEYEKRAKDAEEAGLPAPPAVLMPEEACHPRLMTDIAEAKPVVALALGVAAVKAVAAAYDVPYGAKGRKARVGEAKISSLKRVLGSPVCPPGKPVIVATYHPAWTARQGNKHYGHIVHGHIAKAARIAARGGSLDWKDADITTLDPTIEQVRETFARFAAHDAPVYCDIETDSAMARTATLRCIGYGQLRADGLWEVIVVPFRRIDGTAFWSPEDEAVLRAECLAFHKRVKLAGHNFVMFDSEKLLREGLLDDWAQSFNDTMLRHRNTVANDAPHSLGFCISQYTEAPAHKDDANDKYLDGGADDTALHGYCLNALTRIRLADGTTDTIRRLLKRQGPIDVLSLNLRTHKIESRRVTRFYRTDAPGQMWVEVKHARQLPHHTGAITTPEHEWYTDRGWVRADKLVPGDRVCTAELQFSADQMAAVLGTVLGDSTLVHSPAFRHRPETAPSACLQLGHAAYSGLTQEKIRCLSDVLEFSQQLVLAHRVRVVGREGWGTPAHHASSRNRLQLQDVYLRIYRDGVRTVSEDVLDALGPVGLAWWFMDDGCKQKGSKTKNTGVRGGRLYAPDSVVIATQSFSRDEVDLTVRWFCRRYGPTSAGKDRVLRLSRSASVAFTEDVAPYVFPAQRYKFPRDLTLPPFVDIARSGGHPLMVEVSHVGPAVPIEGPNVRYCLDVEGNHNFFTTSGLVHNCAKDVHRTGIVDISLREENAACGTEEAYKTDFDTAPVYRNMGDLGMVIDMAKHREMWIKFEGQRRALIKRTQDIVGNDKFNPNAPDQVRDFLYRKKGLIPVISTQKGKEWRPGDDPSTNANALQQLILKRALDEQTTQFIDALSKYRAVSKVVGSYIEGLVKDRTPKADLTDEDEEDIKGAPDPTKDLEAYIDWRYARIGEATNTTVTRELYPDLGELFMLHPQYKMHIPTGRVSTTPTCQNWPVIGVANMRELGIVPRGYKFVGADFEQIELRLYAVIADDQVVLEAFHKGLDVHTLNYATLRARNPSDMDEVMRIYHETIALKKRGDEGDKKAKNDVKAWRTLAKRFVYLICYGGETDRLFATMSTDRDKATGDLLFKGLTPQQVSIMYNNWHTVHPWTIQWQEREVAHAKQHGWIQAILDGRKRHFPGGLNKRNAAPNAKIQGCLTRDHRVLLETGLEKIGDAPPRGRVWTGTNWVEYIKANRGPCQLAEIELSNGHIIKCDTRHRVFVEGQDQYEERHFDALAVGDRVCLSMAAPLEFGDTVVSEETAYWLGFATGNGSANLGRRTITVTMGDRKGRYGRDAQLARFHRYIESVGVSPTKPQHKAGCVSATALLRDQWEPLGYSWTDRAVDKRVPRVIWQSNLRARRAFLLGMFDADGTVGPRECVPTVQLCQRELCAELQILLRTVGVESRVAGPYKPDLTRPDSVAWQLKPLGSHMRQQLDYGKGGVTRIEGMLAPGWVVRDFLAQLGDSRPRGLSESSLTLIARLRKGGSTGVYRMRELYDACSLVLPPLYAIHTVRAKRVLSTVEDTFTLALADPLHRFDGEGVIHKNSAAAITNRAVKILGDLIRHREWGIMSGLNLQIHDYIGAYVPAARADEAARMIQESMETTYMGMPFPAVPVISESWATQ